MSEARDLKFFSESISHEEVIDKIMREMEEHNRLERRRGSADISELDARPFTPTLSHSRKNSFVPSEKKPGKIYPSHMTNDRYYDMSHPRLGRAVIFNQREISGQGTRIGTNKDMVDLTDVLEDFGFAVTVHQDYSYKRIKETLLSLSNEDHSASDCLVVAMMSHGKSEGRIYASDGDFDVSELWDPFIGDTGCHTLIGKPKLFFIQACKGEMADPGILLKKKAVGVSLTPQGDSTDSQVESSDYFFIPVMADLLIMYSTSEGYISYRNPATGSAFIQALCGELQENPQEELFSILTGVNRRVAFGFQSNIPNSERYDAAKQMPCMVSTLTKSFYFRKRGLQVDHTILE